MKENKNAKLKKKIAELEARVVDTEASLASTYFYASDQLNNLSEAKMTASGVVITIKKLGGREGMMPAMIRDGLRPETIAALKAELKKSYELATLFKPEG